MLSFRVPPPHLFCSTTLHRCGNGTTFVAKWKASLLPPGLAAVCWSPSVILLLVCICSEQVPHPLQLQHSQRRYGWEALGCTLGPLSFFSRGPHLCPRTSSATWHLSLDGSGPFFVLQRTRLPATPHSACC